MTSLIVTGSVELQLDTLAERVATRVVELLRDLEPPAGSQTYEREPDPDPGAGPTRGRVRDNLDGEAP